MRDLLDRLARLRAHDPQCRVFGAETHRYRRQPADAATLARFEDLYGARLPDAFRRLLLEVTDGGAGPGYGLIPLDRSREDDTAEDLALLGQPFDHDAWFALEPPDVDPDDDDAYERATLEYWREMPGTLTLCHYGCAIRAYLVVTGARAGQVLLDTRTDFTGVHPFTLASGGAYNAWGRPTSDDTQWMDVLAWYRDWLDASLAMLYSSSATPTRS